MVLKLQTPYPEPSIINTFMHNISPPSSTHTDIVGHTVLIYRESGHYLRILNANFTTVAMKSLGLKLVIKQMCLSVLDPSWTWFPSCTASEKVQEKLRVVTVVVKQTFWRSAEWLFLCRYQTCLCSLVLSHPGQAPYFTSHFCVLPFGCSSSHINFLLKNLKFLLIIFFTEEPTIPRSSIR